MEFRFIDTRDPLYGAERALRVELLREPLGMPPGSELFPYEGESLHLVAVDEGRVLGCVLFHREGDGGRLFQMAVAKAWQRRGIGRQLVRTLEARLALEGVREITIHARAEAISFYEGLGYEVTGEPFTEIGIPHRTMTKRLTWSPA